MRKAHRFSFLLTVVLLTCLSVGGILTPLRLVAQDQDAGGGFGDATTVWNPVTNTPSFLDGPIALPFTAQTQSSSATALAFLDAYGAEFGIADVETELQELSETTDSLGHIHVTLQQVYQGIPVYNGIVKVHLSPNRDQVVAASSSFLPQLAVPTASANVSDVTAAEYAHTFSPNGEVEPAPQLVIYVGSGSSRSPELATLAWLVIVNDFTIPQRTLYVVAADELRLLDSIDLIQDIDSSLPPATPNQPSAPLTQEPIVDAAAVNQPDIIGGEESADGAWPWMASIGIENFGHYCGGTLLYPGWILTAAHCMYYSDGSLIDYHQFYVVLGKNQLSANGGERLKLEQSAIIHENYNPNTQENDIALLKLVDLSTQLPLPSFVSENDNPLFQPEKHVTVMGWGDYTTENGTIVVSGSDRLRQVTVPIVPNDVCDDHPDYKGKISDTMLCAGYEQGGRDSCQGDSGGPLVLKDQREQWLQAGIVSWGIGCAEPHQYGVYTRVASYHDWIVEQLTPICVDEATNGIPLKECQALVLFNHSTGGENWRYEEGEMSAPWLSNSQPCTWLGVKCSEQNGDETRHVLEIDLYNRDLTGALPRQINGLSHLTMLQLALNEIGGYLPTELGELQQLVHLEIWFNQLQGNVPAELGNLSNLQTLELGYNNLTGVLPRTLGNLSSMRYLDLSGNQFTGQIPTELGNLYNLKTLILGENKLSGNIPRELANLSSLESLSLDLNTLTGSIPPEFGQLSNLRYLGLSMNQLSGTIPPALGNLSQLRNLNIAQNQLSGNIPPELGNLSTLDYMSVNDNTLIGPLNIDLTNLQQLSWFDFSDTHLCIPDDEVMEGWIDSIATLISSDFSCADQRTPTRIATYTANNTEALPGVIARVDDDPSIGDTDIDNAHDFAAQTLAYYQNTHNRTSFDDNGAVIVSTAHYGQNYLNAAWTGQQMLYGDGFATLDVVAHELTHAVTNQTANLEYRWQSGALNESFSDIFGVLVDRDDWLIGEDLPDSILGGRNALRDMANPERLDDPGHTDQWSTTCADNEAVHTNSSIFNKAFYQIATASNMDKQKAELVFYRALTVYLGPTSTFADARAMVLRAAGDFYGDDSPEYAAIATGFDSVGLTEGWAPPANSCSCGATVALAGTAEGEDELETIYTLRDFLFTQDPGQRWSEIYYDHQLEVASILLMNEDVRNQATSVLLDFQPVFRSLVGEQSAAPVTLTSELVESAKEAVMAMADQASPSLREDILREWGRIEPDRFVGWEVNQVWQQLEQEEIDFNLLLPQISQ